MRVISRMTAVVTASVALVAVLSISASAQHLISSRAGFVNRADGKVMILRQDSTDGEKGRASLGSQMRNGDRLFTEAGSYSELLLNPGSYLRLNENAEVRAVNTSLMQISFEIVSGAVNLEVGEVDKKTPIEIVTRAGNLYVVKEGIYRIEAKGGMTSVAARQGDIQLGTRDEALIGKGYRISRGKSAMFNDSSSPVLAKIDKDKIDNFDVWCFNRAQTLVSANQMALRQSRNSNSLAYGWFFDPFNSCYTFMPRRGLFYSPYGFGFFNSYGNCFTCGYGPYGYYYNPYNYLNNGVGGAGTPNAPARVVAGIDRAPIQRSMESRRVDGASTFDSGVASRGGFGDIGGSRTVSSSASTSVISMPVPSRGGDSGGGASGGAAPSRPSRP